MGQPHSSLVLLRPRRRTGDRVRHPRRQDLVAKQGAPRLYGRRAREPHPCQRPMSERLPERITVSVETLRGELAQLELRLVDRLTSALAQKADLAHIDQLETRVNSLELSRASREWHAQALAE